MPTPEFIREIRQHIGTHQLWIPSSRGVVVRRISQEPEVLLVKRSDNGAWTVTAGILEPGEEPAVGAVREIEEETGVIARPVRLAGVMVSGPVQYPNGDQCVYMDTIFEMEHLSGEPRVNDAESVQAGWFSVSELPEPMSADQHAAIGWALEAGAPAKFFTE